MLKKTTEINEKLKFHTASDLESYRVTSIYIKEPETIEWIKFWSERTNGVFYDIGANIGIYSLYAAHLGNVEVFSFEPVQNNFSQLNLNIELNEFNNVFPFNIAVSNENKLNQLEINDLRVGNSGAQLNTLYKTEKMDVLKQEKVISLSIDSLIDQYGFPCPSFIKIDVDGIESLILQGMKKTLENENLKSVLVEFNDQEEFDLNAQFLKSFRFNIDNSFDGIENHSTKRRKAKNSSIRNYIFTRQ